MVIQRIFLLFALLIFHGFSYGLSLKRVDFLYTYEYLDPNNVYGNWHTLEADTYFQAPFQLTPFMNIAFSNRTKEGKAVLYAIGAYKDWTDVLYTYSALSFGTNSVYFPKYRIDHEFNLKTGVQKNIVLSAGIAYARYWDVHKDLIFSVGLTIYQGYWVFTGKVFRNISNPGNVTSHSALISVGYGEEKVSWLYLDVYYGKQAYLATYLSTPEEINQNAFISTLNYRKWLTASSGIIGVLGFMNLEDGYKKYRFSAGVFKEF